MRRIGAHVRTSGGLVRAAERATAIGADCAQIFVGSPQTWARPSLDVEEVAAFHQQLAARDIAPIFVHAPYLINLASNRAEVRSSSRRMLTWQLIAAGQIGALGLVVHVGSGDDGAFGRVADGLRAALHESAAAGGTAALILENDAGSGQRIGRGLTQLGALIDAAGGDDRLRLCFDTAHALAAGYELRTPAGVAAVLAELSEEIGLSRLALFHVNDSKVELGRNVDRHENLGRGKIGLAAFTALLAEPRLAEVPLVLEVPGYAGEGPDAPSVALLRLVAGNRLAELPAWRTEHFAGEAADEPAGGATKATAEQTELGPE